MCIKYWWAFLLRSLPSSTAAAHSRWTFIALSGTAFQKVVKFLSALLQLIWWQFVLSQLYSHVLLFNRRGFSLVTALGCYILLESGWTSMPTSGVCHKPKCCTDSSLVLQGSSSVLQQLPPPLSVSSASVCFSFQLAQVHGSLLHFAFAKMCIVFCFFVHTKCFDRGWNNVG